MIPTYIFIASCAPLIRQPDGHLKFECNVLHSNVDFYFKFDEYSKFEFFLTALLEIQCQGYKCGVLGCTNQHRSLHLSLILKEVSIPMLRAWTSAPDNVGTSYFVLSFWNSFLALCKANVAKVMLPSRATRMIVNRNVVVKNCIWKQWVDRLRVSDRFSPWDCLLLVCRNLKLRPLLKKGTGAPAHLHLKGNTQKHAFWFIP